MDDLHMEGRREGMTIRVERGGARDHKGTDTRHTAYRASIQHDLPSMMVYEKGLLSTMLDVADTLGEDVRVDDLEIGHRAFDETFVVYADDHEAVRDLLDQRAVREVLLELSEQGYRPSLCRDLQTQHTDRADRAAGMGEGLQLKHSRYAKRAGLLRDYLETLMHAGRRLNQEISPP